MARAKNKPARGKGAQRIPDPEVLDEFPTRPRRRVYPWDRWLADGEARQLVKGTHYRCSTESMRAAVYKQAKALDRHIRTQVVDLVEDDPRTGEARVVGEGLVIQLTDEPYRSGLRRRS